MSKARVSIGIPVYNGSNYVAEAIESVLAQTYGDFELILSDNASTDATEEICRDYAAHDSRVRYHRETVNRGAPVELQSHRGAFLGRILQVAGPRRRHWADLPGATPSTCSTVNQPWPCAMRGRPSSTTAATW